MRNTTMKAIEDKIKNADDYTIFVVGDSITYGFRATTDEDTYTAVFARMLAKLFPDRTVVRYDGQIFPTSGCELLPLKSYSEPKPVQVGSNGKVNVVRSGIGGNSVARMLKRASDFIGKEIDGKTADLFLINVGINDSLKSDPKKYVTCDEYKANLNTLLDQIEANDSSADIILITPSYNDHGTSDVSSVDDYASAMKSVAESRKIPLIDLHAAWMDHLVINGENYGQGDWLTGIKGDYCHPSNIGHQKIAEVIFNGIFADE